MIYFVEAIGADRVKIGFSGGDKSLSHRLENLQVASPFEIALLGVTPGDVTVEATLHERFSRARVRGEWFRLEPIRAEIVGLVHAWIPDHACPGCGSIRPISTMRKGYERCNACAKAKRKKPDLQCGECGVALSAKASQQHRKKNTPPRCRACAQGARKPQTYEAWWKAGLKARGVDC